MRIRYDVQLKVPNDLTEVWQTLVENVGAPPVSIEKTANLKPIAAVLNQEHNNEEEFDEGLFKALRKCLSNQGLVQVIKDPTRDSVDRVATKPAAASTVTRSSAAARRLVEALYSGQNMRKGKNTDAGATEPKVLTESFVVAQKREASNNLNPVYQSQESLDPIVFNYGLDDHDNSMYSIGIARLASGQQRPSSPSRQRSSNSSELYSSKTSGQRSSGRSDCTSSDVAANSKLDHCSCLLERTARGGKWRVLRTFSVVELKALHDSECAFVSVDENNLQSVDIMSADGAVAQALSNTMAWALPNHAEVDELQDLVWTAIIGKRRPGAGPKIDAVDEGTDSENEEDREETEPLVAEDSNKKQSTKKPSNKYRWLAGKIYVPQKCGDPFQYSATSCGNLKSDASVSGAISVYLETLIFGLCAAKRLLKLIKSPSVIVPFPTSGKKVMIGSVELPNLKLRGKPTESFREDPNNKAWKVSQGEIFTGQINFRRLNIDLQEDDTEAVFLFKDDDVPVNVAFKIASLCVHRYLNPPSEAWNALTIINTAYLNSKSRKTMKPEEKLGDDVKSTEGKSNEEEESDNYGNKWDLFSVLFAAERFANGLITIMADLSMDYEVLAPRDNKLSFDVLWHAFHDLLTRILIPLADLKLIHPDIRPGWDVTSNILFIKNSQDSSEKPSMQIIDFDSLVENVAWKPPQPKVPGPRFKYIPRKHKWSCYTFLWWQCATLAFSWYKKVTQLKMQSVNLKAMLSDDTHEFSILLGKECCALVNKEKIKKHEFMLSLHNMTATMCGKAHG